MTVAFEVIVDMTTGQPTQIGSARGTVPAEGPIEEGSNFHRFYVSDDIDMGEFLDTKYRRLDGSTEWHTRTACPDHGYYEWNTTSYSWVQNLTKLWDEVRMRRAGLLGSSDWTQNADSPLSTEKKAEWATYRQTLRDLPSAQSSVTSMDDITWPTPPS
tara:strand:+ start:1124 stop:1597 length:474 start_codon:yes stop_codon:yes gene_type:complete